MALDTTTGDALLEELESAQPTITPSDGNAYAIMAAATKALNRFGIAGDYTVAEIDAAKDTMLDDMKSGEYDHLLQVAMRYFEVDV